MQNDENIFSEVDNGNVHRLVYYDCFLDDRVVKSV